MKAPDKNSNRSKKRKARGFNSLEKSSRKHRRAAARLAIAKVNVPAAGGHFQHIGGSINYH